MRVLLLLGLLLAGSPAWAIVDLRSDYGAICNGVSDDSAAFNAALDAARAKQAVSPPTLNGLTAGAGIIRLPVGTCGFAAINGTGLNGVMVEGAGPLATHIRATGNAYAVLDFTGSKNVGLRDFSMGDPGSSVQPNIGVLLADTGTNGLDGFTCSNVTVTGRYGISALYNMGVGMTWTACDWWNFAPSPSTAVAVTLTTDNRNGITSPYAVFGPGIEHFVGGTLMASGIHQGASNQAVALICRGCSGLVMLGGSLDSSGPAFVLLEAAGPITPLGLLFLGAGFYSELGLCPGVVFLAISSASQVNLIASPRCAGTLVGGPGTVTL